MGIRSSYQRIIDEASRRQKARGGGTKRPKGRGRPRTPPKPGKSQRKFAKTFSQNRLRTLGGFTSKSGQRFRGRRLTRSETGQGRRTRATGRDAPRGAGGTR